ncbi:hypothetical protein [Castellaniella caeni]|uniref:hypothetical protein n=1 Tax=Castellaniella caeni TaxID=266123 RepID=UPI000C9FC03B|nr:hypothetical protein [Castellaniella caeni]
MKTIFILNPDELDRQYERLLPLFDMVPKTPEYTPLQLFERAKAQKATVGYCEENGIPQIAFAFEFIYYPNLTAINIIALAGSGFEPVAANLLARLKDFARQAGADCIEALCIDGMARLLRKYGFEKASTQVRVMI